MRKLIIFLLMTSFCYTQKPQPIPPELYGNWYNLDQELLTIQPNETFIRRDTQKPGTIADMDPQFQDQLNRLYDYAVTKEADEKDLDELSKYNV